MADASLPVLRCAGHSENQRQVKNPRIVPTFVPTVTNVTVSQGDLATLPCSVKNLGTRQV